MSKKKKVKWIVLSFCAVIVLSFLIFYFIIPTTIDRRMNRLPWYNLSRVSDHSMELHQSLTVVDSHSDTLLWKRDITVRNNRGQVDFPRMREGNQALQIFTVVTKTPRGVNLHRNRSDSDILGWLMFANRWPPSTWIRLRERALYQAKKLHGFQERDKSFSIIKSASDLKAFLEKRKRSPQMIAGLLGIEGAHPLEGNLQNINVLYDAGFRMFGLVHFFDNEMAGSAHGIKKYGLTLKGKVLVRIMEEKGILVDLAHASPRTIDDVLAISTKPMIVSHTGVKGTCNNMRNLYDHHIKGIADRGGVICIGYWPAAICHKNTRAIVRAIKYVADMVGAEHVGLGSDFDGAERVPFDSAGLVLLTDGLLKAGFSDKEIRLIMGENVVRLLLAVLPQ